MQHLGRVGEVIQNGASLDGARQRLRPEREGGDDTEVATTAADCPEEVGFALGVCLDH